MTLIKTKTLYDRDFALWIDETTKKLKSGDFSQVDLENLIEEVEALGKRDRKTLKSHLRTLFEHALKRAYVVNFPECYRGWEVTINRTLSDIEDILDDSPSLRNFVKDNYLKCYKKAMENVQIEYDVDFPEVFPFSDDMDKLLDDRLFWKNIKTNR